MKIVEGGRSGQLIATNDVHIERLLEDPLYDVRIDGSIWTRRMVTGHICDVWRECAIQINKNRGYKEFTFGTKHIRHVLQVHRIMYRKFKGPLERDLVINHIDEDPLNNSPENLELVTQSQNLEHRFRNKPGVSGNRKLTDAEVLEIRELQKAGWTNRKLREYFGTSKGNISDIVNFKTFKNLEGISGVTSISDGTMQKRSPLKKANP